MGNHGPNPESKTAPRSTAVRALALAVVQAVEREDLQGARAAANALVPFLVALTGDTADTDTGNDNGMRAGLASASPVLPRFAPRYLSGSSWSVARSSVRSA